MTRYAEDIYCDAMAQAEMDVIRQALSAKPGDRLQYTRIKFQMLKSVWESFMRTGIVLKPQLVDKIEYIMTYNTCLLSITSAGMGHDRYWPWDEWKDKYELSDDDIKKLEAVFYDDLDYYEWAMFSNRQPLLSDYGLKPLNDLLYQLLHEQDYVRKIVIIDQMLNVTHQRSDLAELYVEGGSESLSLLSGSPSELQTA